MSSGVLLGIFLWFVFVCVWFLVFCFLIFIFLSNYKMLPESTKTSIFLYSVSVAQIY